jgi:excisionase family DNA binding protein
MGDWVAPSEAARRLGVSVVRVRQWADQGRLSAIRTPLGRLIEAESVERLSMDRQPLLERAKREREHRDTR